MVTGQHCHLSGQFLLQPITRNILSIIIDSSDRPLHEITFYGLYLPWSAYEIDTSISILETSGTVFFSHYDYAHQLESVNYITQTEYLKKESSKSAGKTAKKCKTVAVRSLYQHQPVCTTILFGFFVVLFSISAAILILSIFIEFCLSLQPRTSNKQREQVELSYRFFISSLMSFLLQIRLY